MFIGFIRKFDFFNYILFWKWNSLDTESRFFVSCISFYWGWWWSLRRIDFFNMVKRSCSLFLVSYIILHSSYYIQNEKHNKLMNLLLCMTRIEYNMVGRVKACDDDLRSNNLFLQHLAKLHEQSLLFLQCQVCDYL